jgi:hypothetical protein
MVLAELPGATCVTIGGFAAILHGTHVYVTLIGAPVAGGVLGATSTLVNCAGASTVVQAVGTGFYS